MPKKEKYEPVIEKAGYQGLANAIIMSAVGDYRNALRKLHKNAKDSEAKDELQRVRRFFLSQWFSQLCGLDPYWLMRGIEKQMSREGYKRKVSKKF